MALVASAASAFTSPPATQGSFRHLVYRSDDSRFEFFPITNYVNTAIDTDQVSLAFRQSGYWSNHGKVFDFVADPHGSIVEDGGYDELLQQEFASTHVLPNLTLHLLGNGYDFRALAEWFDHHRVPFPRLLAFVTSYAGYIGNEAIEASNPEINALDHIADLYIFNLVGNLLFLNDDFVAFVQDRLRMRNWAGQPVFDARSGKILNASNNYVARPDLFGNGVRPFLYFGLHYFGGLSFRLNGGSSLSTGFGLATKDPFRDELLDKIRPSGGLFWDRDDRLLASAVFNGTDESAVRVNLYPGFFARQPVDVGFFLGMSRHGVPAIGISVHKLLAIGFK